MKKILLRTMMAAMLVAPGLAKAQYTIPNGSFENWLTSSAPKDWQVISGIIEQAPIVHYTLITNNGADTEKLARPAYDGSNSIEMASQNGGAVPAIIQQKFAFTGKPQNWSMNYAYFPGTQNDRFEIEFVFTKWNPAKASKHDTILVYVASSAPGTFSEPWSYALNATPLTGGYNSAYSTENPDTAIIAISTQTAVSSATCALFIDEIYFTDTPVTAGLDNGTASDNQNGVSAYPNPSTGQTTIRYHIAQSGHVSLNVYDESGKQVATLVDGQQVAGLYEQAFDASGLNNGMYFYRLQSGDNVQTGKLILNR